MYLQMKQNKNKIKQFKLISLFSFNVWPEIKCTINRSQHGHLSILIIWRSVTTQSWLSPPDRYRWNLKTKQKGQFLKRNNKYMYYLTIIWMLWVQSNFNEAAEDREVRAVAVTVKDWGKHYRIYDLTCYRAMLLLKHQIKLLYR